MKRDLIKKHAKMFGTIAAGAQMLPYMLQLMNSPTAADIGRILAGTDMGKAVLKKISDVCRATHKYRLEQSLKHRKRPKNRQKGGMMRKRGWTHPHADAILFKHYNRKARIKRALVRARGARKNVV